jgi:hypothetical protein
MQLVPNRFLFRVSHPCRLVAGIPDDDEDLFDLPEACRLENFAAMEGQENFADVRLAWNDDGLAVQVDVRGKDQPPQGDATRPRSSDGLTLWIDTRDARSGHRATRFCHQFHFLPTGGGPDRDEPAFVQSPIHRALAEAPTADPATVAFRVKRRAGGYRLTAFLPAAALAGFDPAQSPRWGIFYRVLDAERGEQLLGAGPDLPYAEDPSLWGVLELVKGG